MSEGVWVPGITDLTVPVGRERLERIFVRGSKMGRKIQDRIIGAELSWATDQVTQLSLSFTDPNFELWEQALFERGTPLVYRDGRDLNLRVRSFTLDPGPTGTGGFTINARSELVQKLKNRRGPKVMRKSSPSEFVAAEVKAVGGKAVVQKSPQRQQVKRDVARKGDEDAQGADKPSSWTTFGRLASELGFICFEFGDVIYFAKPTWLAERDTKPLRVALPLAESDFPAKLMARGIPTVTTSEDASEPLTIEDLLIERDRFSECNPGGAMKLLGLEPFDDPYLIQSLNMRLLGSTDPLTLRASTPKNPKPQPPAKRVKASTINANLPGLPGGATQSGSRSAYDFVTMAITASNAAYVYGAEASSSDATPAALDCSELIQWALGRIGVAFVDGSSAQIAACTDISVAQAMATRGALLYKLGHIGISMGDGRSVEARNPSAGVGIFRAADIAWTDGGLVPGLRYG